MIRRTKQDWSVGKIVKVGFLRLMITGITPTPGDFRPDKYHLLDPKTEKRYTFTPHWGLEAA